MTETNCIYQQLESSTMAGALECVCQTFRETEPLTSYLRVSSEEFEPFVEELLLHSLKGGLSWVALDSSSGKVIGVRIVVDFDNDYAPTQNFGAKMNTIFEFLSYVSLPIKKLTDLTKEKVVHSHMVAVDSTYQRSGIARELLRRTSIEAYKLGYRISIGEITNQYNRKLLAQFPSFQSLHWVYYRDYEVNGQRPFDKLLEHDACVLYQIKLEDFLKR